MSAHVTRADLLALALPEETKLRVIRRFALWCAEQAVAARIERGWQCPRAVWICLLRTRRCLDDRSPAALAKLNRARRKAAAAATTAVAPYATTAVAPYATAYADAADADAYADAAAYADAYADAAAYAYAYAATAADASAAADAAAYASAAAAAASYTTTSAQREALTQIVLEELALTAVQDWRPSESMPEDYCALGAA